MFRWFENRVTPYPETAPEAPPKKFFAFLWTCSEGLRPYILGMTLCTAVIGAFEALLFAMLGRIVDWLADVEPARLWTEQRGSLLLLAAILAASPVLVALQTMLKHQALAGQFPDAPALELPPPAAPAEHELLPGRVRRACRHQGDADRAGRARHLAHGGRHPGLHHDLLRDDGRGGGQLRRLAAPAVPRLGRAVRGGAGRSSCRGSARSAPRRRTPAR